MDRRELENAGETYRHLRGLFLVPLGCAGVLAALGNWRWGPLRADWVFLGALLVLLAVGWVIDRYYAEQFGRVTPTTRTELRLLLAGIAAVALMVVLSLLLRSRAGWSLDLPVNPVAASFGVLMLVSRRVTIGVRAHDVAVWGALLAVGLLPVWGGVSDGDTSNVGLVLAGVASIVAGVLDHRLLVRTFAA